MEAKQTIAVALVVAFALSACAPKAFVRPNPAAVNHALQELLFPSPPIDQNISER